MLVGAWGLSVAARQTLISTELNPDFGESPFFRQVQGLDQALERSPEWAQLFDLGSDLGQAAMALLVVFGPWWLGGSKRNAGGDPYPILQNTVRLLRAAAINGVLLEWVRIAVQRPRPYVIEKAQISASTLGVSDFTSFYSGHTSFSFAALATLTFLVRAEEDSNQNPVTSSSRKALAVLGVGLTIASITGLMRVFAGRHHLSDVLTGATMGLLCGIIAARLKPPQNPS